MNSPEMMPGDDTQNLRSEVESLRFAFSFAVLLMFIFNMSVYVYFSHQANIMTGMANESEAVVNAYESSGKGQAITFWNEMTDFGAKHPDFAPIMAKYQSVMSVTPAPAAKK